MVHMAIEIDLCGESYRTPLYGTMWYELASTL